MILVKTDSSVIADSEIEKRRSGIATVYIAEADRAVFLIRNIFLAELPTQLALYNPHRAVRLLDIRTFHGAADVWLSISITDRRLSDIVNHGRAVTDCCFISTLPLNVSLRDNDC